ncbi:AAA family ATPase [Methylophaga sp.]|uniref:AAA family ATPase n=1 Tax=Methylophaga sp. TaxID=2024840 RepID=UPI003F72D5BA
MVIFQSETVFKNDFEKIIILLSGPVGVGKSSVALALENQFDFIRLKSSSFLMQKASSLGLEQTRSNLQNLGDELDIATDYFWVVSEVVVPVIKSTPQHKFWLFDSVRKERQVKHFKDEFGCKAVYHFHLTADESTLQSRFLSRDSSATTADYLATISHSNEKASRSLLSTADHVLDIGNKTLDEIISEIIKITTTKLKE